MKLSCYSTEFVAALKKDAAKNSTLYSGSVESLSSRARPGIDVRETGIECEALPNLKSPSDDQLWDAENATALHTALKVLSPLQAMDERLWVFLSHGQYGEYMKRRWPVTSEGSLLDRYFFAGTGFATLVRNGISRLWWFGHMTWDPKRNDPYELTRILLCNQDVQQALLQRSFGKSRPVLHAILDHIQLHQGTIYAESVGTKIKRKAKMLNVLGGVCLLDAMPKSDIHDFLSAP
jgi:hypothetical protein